ncbi:MAG: ATP-binding cassette domain-containing protein [Lachnospiraceae bacterium]|nr:ATP-binding cassette domain-containing protein [Lachnospiraceae bacterium]
MLKVNINKKLDKINLSINFEVEKGVLGLFGASAAGKSMTLKIIAGIEKPDSGKIVLNDKVLFDSEKKINLPPQQRRIGYLFQNYALFPQMTLYNNIYISVNKKYNNCEKKEKVNNIINQFGLNGFENKYPKELSGGQQQRVALARIIVNEPEFLLLDEPFSAVDAFLKLKLMKELQKVLQDFNKEAIFVTHDLREIEYICDDILVISNGSIIEKGNKNNIIKKMEVSYG